MGSWACCSPATRPAFLQRQSRQAIHHLGQRRFTRQDLCGFEDLDEVNSALACLAWSGFLILRFAIVHFRLPCWTVTAETWFTILYIFLNEKPHKILQLHLVPHFQGDTVVIDASFGHPTRAELDATAAALSKQVDR